MMISLVQVRSITALAGGMALLFLLEVLFPLRRRSARRLPRYVVNGVLSALAFLAGACVVTPASLAASVWCANHHVGILHIVSLPPSVAIVAGIILSDLGFYYWHRLNHEIPFLWRFHVVHHIDPDLDVTTSFRFHAVEVLLSAAFRIMLVTAAGITPLIYVVHEVCLQAATMFHHSNIRLTIGLERLINHIFVTPRMHGIHHSAVREETNADYGVIFRAWDRLHRTLNLGVAQQSITIGVPGYGSAEDNRLWRLLTAPFRRQRASWEYPGGATAMRAETALGDRTRLME